ncbi:MAG TPA: hypothetical protein VFY21_10685 [Xanthobacteraceae bacterium]|nr:hypothetical protein [Xanthobacteraceae bacterium]
MLRGSRSILKSRHWATAVLLAAGLAGCAGDSALSPGPTQPIAAAPAIPPAAIAGRWGLASYHREEDRGRTEQQARAVCNNPYEIGLGPNGGVMMHPADQNQRVELAVKGASGNRTFVGPPGEPGQLEDREIVAFDGQIMVMRWMDPEVASRFGTIVFARCSDATAARPPASRPAPARTNR